MITDNNKIDAFERMLDGINCPLCYGQKSYCGSFINELCDIHLLSEFKFSSKQGFRTLSYQVFYHLELAEIKRRGLQSQIKEKSRL